MDKYDFATLVVVCVCILTLSFGVGTCAREESRFNHELKVIKATKGYKSATIQYEGYGNSPDTLILK